ITVLDANNDLLVGLLRGHTRPVISSGFSTDGTYLATGSKDRTVRVWDLEKVQLAAGPFYGHGGSVTSVALSSDYTRVVSCSTDDTTIRVWSVRKTRLRPATPLNPSPSSSMGSSPVSILEDWKIQGDGWVTNSSSALLFWVPSDFVSSHVWPSPPSHAEFIITKNGVLHIPEQELMLGEEWSRCYISN
ncbi:putative vegetative incompatibility protein HET-E-1, partial [Rhizoctonia solani 123E]